MLSQLEEIVQSYLQLKDLIVKVNLAITVKAVVLAALKLSLAIAVYSTHTPWLNITNRSNGKNCHQTLCDYKYFLGNFSAQLSVRWIDGLKINLHIFTLPFLIMQSWRSIISFRKE